MKKEKKKKKEIKNRKDKYIDNYRCGVHFAFSYISNKMKDGAVCVIRGFQISCL